MHKGDGLAALPPSSQRLVLDLLSHTAVKRLQAIQQLGFSTHRQQRRLEHTLDSLELISNLLTKAPNVSADLRDHLLAAVALEDIGRGPFSNSLDSMFVRISGMEPDKGKVDVQRSILAIEHFEAKEKLLSRRQLSCDVVCGLLKGDIPWRKASWLKSMLDGPTDVDRLAYVRGDTERADGIDYDLTGLLRGLSIEPNVNQTIIDVVAIDNAIDFFLQRATLYVNLYYDPIKLALEHVVRLFLRKLWEFTETANDRWTELREPKSIEEFLLWTDETIIGAFEGDRWSEAPAELERLRNLIRDGQLKVAEIQDLRVTAVDLDIIDLLLEPVKRALQHKNNCWILDREKLPVLRVYEAETVVVHQKGGFLPLEKRSEQVARLARPGRRIPLLIFRGQDFDELHAVFEQGGLVFSRARSLDWIKRSPT